MHFTTNQSFPLVCLLLRMLCFKTDTTLPFTSLPFCIMLVFSNTATDYRRRQSTVIPTTKLRSNLSGRESDLVIIRMDPFIWFEKSIVVGQKHHIIFSIKWVPALFFIQCLVWTVLSPLFWYLKEPSDSLLMVGFGVFFFFKYTNTYLSLVSFLTKHIHLCSLGISIRLWSSNWENLQLT